MVLAARGKSYDRSRLMKRAAAARRKRKPKKAIAFYRQVLEVEPENADIHQKLAPLLAQTRQRLEALASYRRAVESLLQAGFHDQAIGLLREAVGYMPREVELWRGVASLENGRGRAPDAVKALVDGRAHFRSKQQRPEAMRLLNTARKLDPSNFAVSYDLAGLMAKSGRQPQALRLLDELASGGYPGQMRRVRARQLRLDPSCARALGFLRALFLGR